MAIRKSIGAKVDQEHFDQITQFCDKNGISKVELVLDGVAVMMGRDARVYERVNELQDNLVYLQDNLEYTDDKLKRIMARGFWARVFNKGV